MHAVIRRYTNAGTLIDEMNRRSNEVESIISSVPGFTAYHAVRVGDSLVTISIFRDRDGTEESTRRAAEWVRDNLPVGSVSPPEVTEGDVFIDFAAAHTAGVGATRG